MLWYFFLLYEHISWVCNASNASLKASLAFDFTWQPHGTQRWKHLMLIGCCSEERNITTAFRVSIELRSREMIVTSHLSLFIFWRRI